MLVALCLSVIPAMAAETYTFTVPNSVNVGSPVGSYTGWGYSIHNESSSLWLVTTELSSSTFQYATPTLLFDFPDLAPGASVTVPFDPLTSAGLFEIAWNTSVPLGLVNSGTFDLSAQWWNGDPLKGGGLVSAAPSLSQPYSASLTTTPEPATIGLAGVAFSVFVILAWSHRRRRSVAHQLRH